jgi:hypothetical protein
MNRVADLVEDDGLCEQDAKQCRQAKLLVHLGRAARRMPEYRV